MKKEKSLTKEIYAGYIYMAKWTSGFTTPFKIKEQNFNKIIAMEIIPGFHFQRVAHFKNIGNGFETINPGPTRKNTWDYQTNKICKGDPLAISNNLFRYLTIF